MHNRPHAPARRTGSSCLFGSQSSRHVGRDGTAGGLALSVTSTVACVPGLDKAGGRHGKWRMVAADVVSVGEED
jgi:hypothetical protein